MGNEKLAVLIDADNISASQAGEIFAKACSLGEPIARRAYGMVHCFAADGGWTKAQREFGIVSRPQVGNISGKNIADIALVIDAMEFLYKSPCDGICIVSSDSDFTALATKIREGGKSAYGMGGGNTPASFRNACTKFFQLAPPKKKKTAPPPPTAARQPPEESKSPPPPKPPCPRCGAPLEQSWTKSRHKCLVCKSCGGVAAKANAMKNAISEESIGEMLSAAKVHQQAGCVCPQCGASMSLLKVASGEKHIEIDVCGNCSTVWYDKGEFESLLPADGPLVADISAGKAYRREMTLAIAADLRCGRLKVLNDKSLHNVMRVAYHIPSPDIGPITQSLMSQRIIKIDPKSHQISLLPIPS